MPAAVTLDLCATLSHMHVAPKMALSLIEFRSCIAALSEFTFILFSSRLVYLEGHMFVLLLTVVAQVQ